MPPGATLELDLTLVGWKKVEKVTDDGLVTKKTLTDTEEWTRPVEGERSGVGGSGAGVGGGGLPPGLRARALPARPHTHTHTGPLASALPPTPRPLCRLQRHHLLCRPPA